MKTAMLIAWHENNLKNWEHNTMRQREAIRCMTVDVERSEANVDFLRAQIDEAKRRGKTHFDSDRFLKGGKK